MRTASVSPKAKQIVDALVAARKAARAAGQGSTLVDPSPLGCSAEHARNVGIFTGFVCTITPDGKHVIIYS